MTVLMNSIENRPIFVFGSNLAGRHGAGAAYHAKKFYGAKTGIGEGRTGHAYALPTKDIYLRTLPLAIIARHVNTFMQYARENPKNIFQVTRVGCGLAGYQNEHIAPLFEQAPANCLFDKDWEKLLPNKHFWIIGS